MTTEQFNVELGQRVLALRQAGAPFDQIADRLGLTIDSARAMFDRALGTYDSDYRAALEGARLDRLHMAVWPQASAGDLAAVDRVLKISERREKALAEPRSNDHALRQAFDASASSSSQVQEVDAALLEAGRQIADRVDAAVASGDGMEATKAMYLLPHMVNVLRELLATPASRHNAGLAGKAVKESKLAQLRAVQQGDRATG